jgi:hypothetical protein
MDPFVVTWKVSSLAKLNMLANLALFTTSRNWLSLTHILKIKQAA